MIPNFLAIALNPPLLGMSYPQCFVIGVANIMHVLDFSNGTNVDVGPKATLNPCDGRSKSTKMDVGVNVITNIRAYVGELGLMDFMVPTLKTLLVFQNIMHGMTIC
jgi:hypothetical protein